MTNPNFTNLPLEHLAKRMYEQFARQQGEVAFWDYLSDERKQAWIEDVLQIADHIIRELKSKLKPYVPSNGINTTFVMGVEAGRTEERTSLIGMVDKIHEELYDNYEDFKYIMSRKGKAL